MNYKTILQQNILLITDPKESHYIFPGPLTLEQQPLTLSHQFSLKELVQMYERQETKRQAVQGTTHRRTI